MALGIFTDKETQPGEADLAAALGKTFAYWKDIRAFVYTAHPAATEEWNFSGKSFGWSFRLRDSKRVIVYLLPCDGSFKASLVFGQKATDEALASDIAEEAKEEIRSAKVYAEGRGFRIDVMSKATAADMKKLIRIKIA